MLWAFSGFNLHIFKYGTNKKTVWSAINNYCHQEIIRNSFI